jgi:hypothetical protein
MEPGDTYHLRCLAFLAASSDLLKSLASGSEDTYSPMNTTLRNTQEEV